MKSVWTDRLVEAELLELVLASSSPPATPSRIPAPYAIWHVAFSSKSVFRKTRPDRPTRESPSTRATSPSIAAPSSVRICSRTTSASRACLDRDDAAALEAELEISDDRAAESERHRRANRAFGAAASGVVKTSSVGMLTTWRRPSTVSSRRRAPVCARGQADRQVGARPAEAQGVETPLVEQRRSLPRACRCAAATRRRGPPRRAGSCRRPPPRAARCPARRRRPRPSPRSGRRRSSS